jgi:hypothetical protein
MRYGSTLPASSFEDGPPGADGEFDRLGVDDGVQPHAVRGADGLHRRHFGDTFEEATACRVSRRSITPRDAGGKMGCRQRRSEAD